MTNQHGRMVDVELSEDTLIVTPRGIWKLWSLRRSMRIPLAAIDAVRLSTIPDRELQPHWRNPGLGTPGTLAGYTSGPKGRTWWCYKYGAEAVVLDLTLPKLRHVVFIDERGGEIVDAIESRIEASAN